MKKSKLVLLMASAACIVLLAGCGRITPQTSSKDMKGRNCANVATRLENLGFTNISTEALQRGKADYTLIEGQIDSVIINGVEDFEADDKFKPDDPVIITYITKPEENRKERRGFDRKTTSFVDLEYYRFEVPDYVRIDSLERDKGSCSFMYSEEGSEDESNEGKEDATLNILTMEYDKDVFGYNSLDENKEDWIEDCFVADRDKFKLLSTRNFESEDGLVKGITFDYVYSSAGLWYEGVLAVVPNEEEMLLFDMIIPDTSKYLYKTDLEDIATSVVEYRNVITIADTDFVIPFAWKDKSSKNLDEIMYYIAEVDDIKSCFMLMEDTAGADSPCIIGFLTEGNEWARPLSYNTIQKNSDDLVTAFFWFSDVNDAYYQGIGNLRGIVVSATFSGDCYHEYIALSPDNNAMMIFLADEDEDRDNDKEYLEIFKKFLSTGREHYK